MSINEHLKLSAMLNFTWSHGTTTTKSLFHTTTNLSAKQVSSDIFLSRHLWVMNRFTIVHRSSLILASIILFWFIFIVIYMLSPLFIRLLANFKRLDFRSPSNEKICQTMIISPNQYGSFRPSPLIYRSDSFFSTIYSTFSREQTISQESLNITLPTQTNNTSLLEHYLTTYNPLRIDLTNINRGTVVTSVNRDASYRGAPSDTGTRPIANCYAFDCTNKQKFHHGGRYVRLQEQENCSATVSLADDRLSECSTKLTNITLPIVMVTDCSDTRRFHTDIIELNDENKDKE